MWGKSRGIIAALIFSFLFFSGCVSTSRISESKPALYCDPDGCAPNRQRVESKWGPVPLEGGISLGNISNLVAWGEKMEKAENKAVQDINKKIDAIECGPACDKDIEGSTTLSVSLNPAGMDFEDKKCQAAFHSTLEISATSISCSLAQIALLNEIDAAIDRLGEQCKEIAPECGAGAIEVAKNSSDDEEPFNTEEESGLLSCTVKATANVLVRCAKGDTAIRNPEASGEVIADVECKEPKKEVCAAAVTHDWPQTSNALTGGRIGENGESSASTILEYTEGLDALERAFIAAD